MIELEKIKQISFLLNESSLEKAKKLLDVLVSKDEKDVHTQFLLGIYHTKKEEYTLAIPHFLFVKESKEDSIHLPKAIKSLAYCYLKTEDYWKAKELIELSIEHYIDDLQLQNMLGYVYYSLKQTKDALEIYSSILEKDKKNITALNAISYCLCDEYNRPLDAIKLLEPVVNDDPRVLDTLGWAYFKAGDKAKGKLYVRKAFEKNPNHKIIQEHITAIVAIS